MKFLRKMCALKPDSNMCYDCIDRQIDCHIHKNCLCCEHLTIKLDRICDVRDIYEEDVQK